ncbi:hypothetical protein HYS94_01190 [Candidatus Daviesbacteria bacterium]|nr:hypothetical protein [Candidatus Daviesbacteria bacterium]
MYILGISCFYHHSAAAILEDGEILVFCEEERFSKIKNDASFPQKAIEFCLKEAGINSNKLDYIVFYEKPFLKFERSLMISLKYFPFSLSFFVSSMRNFLTEKLWIKSIIAGRLNLNSEKILFVPHHLSHAATSFYSSPFKRAAYLTLDGVGEWTTGSWGRCFDNKIYPVAEMRYPNSVGLLYSTFTSFLGFKINEGEGKIMAMANKGKAKYMDKMTKIVKLNKDSSIKLNLDYFSFHKSSKHMYSKKFAKEFQDLDEFDLASSLQKCIEEIIFTMLQFIYTKTKMENLVYSGGVALNSIVNAKITKRTPFKRVYIPKNCGDNGGALGCALYVYHHVLS